MNTFVIKRDISGQIAQANEALIHFWGRSYLSEVFSDDIAALRKIQKKVTRDFKLYRTLSVVFSAVLLLILMLNLFKITNVADLNKAGILIIFTILSLTNTYRFYKVKVNLEHKIWLLGLMDKIS
ncbi:MAG: hypothetical protein JXR71_01525 [Bacteroidales bacterium]|nr:hypothetical protein [Bacteroidales bacterium]